MFKDMIEKDDHSLPTILPPEPAACNLRNYDKALGEAGCSPCLDERRLGYVWLFCFFVSILDWKLRLAVDFHLGQEWPLLWKGRILNNARSGEPQSIG